MGWRDHWELSARHLRRRSQRRFRLFVWGWRLIFFTILLFIRAANTRRRFDRWYRRYLPAWRWGRRRFHMIRLTHLLLRRAILLIGRTRRIRRRLSASF